MKILPSKELLSEVLGKDVCKVKEIENNTLIYGCLVHDGWYDEINIYELDHKCKEWATNKGYVIIQDTRGYTKAYRFPNGERKFWEDENMDLTIDRIIQACEWIMERTK